MKKIFILLFLCISGCKIESENDVLCKHRIKTKGNLKVINRQCFELSKKRTVALLELEDIQTKKHYFYTMNMVNNKIYLNIKPSEVEELKKEIEIGVGGYDPNKVPSIQLTNKILSQK